LTFSDAFVETAAVGVATEEERRREGEELFLPPPKNERAVVVVKVVDVVPMLLLLLLMLFATLVFSFAFFIFLWGNLLFRVYDFGIENFVPNEYSRPTF
jgi:hypothetical protein